VNLVRARAWAMTSAVLTDAGQCEMSVRKVCVLVTINNGRAKGARLAASASAR
jgi:hypothetical protein